MTVEARVERRIKALGLKLLHLADGDVRIDVAALAWALGVALGSRAKNKATLRLAIDRLTAIWLAQYDELAPVREEMAPTSLRIVKRRA